MKKVNPDRLLKNTNWARFCLNYLNIAELTCTELILFKESKLEETPERNDVLFEIQNLYIPIIYNIKHSIEIFLKAIDIRK